MTRSGTLALLRLALLATFVGSAGAAVAQSSAHSSDDQWKPVRTATKPQPAQTAPQPAAKKWIQPTQSGRRTQAAATTNRSSSGNQTAIRAPKPFVPPEEATALNAAPQSASAAVDTSARPAQRTQQERVAHRPRPTPTGGTRPFDDSWIRPLKQVAFQSGEPEELHTPPGTPEEMPLPGGYGNPSMSSQMAPEMTSTGIQSDGEWIGSPDGSPCCNDGCCSDCGPGCCDGVGGCGKCEPDTLDLCTVGPHDDESCDTVRIRVPKFQELMIFGGVHGFKGPYDQNRDTGNFGFQEGFNVGGKLPFTETGYQFGYQAQQSQLSGDANAGITDSFAQHFFTTGVFRRSRDGFQGGAVWDLLLDERQSSVAFSQVRAEFGFVDCGCHEIGVTGAVHLKNNTFFNPQQQSSITFQSVDQYLLYYRMHGPRGGEGRVYGGLTDDADGIIGSDFAIPLTDSWGLVPEFTYLIPKDNGGTIAAREEAWNISISLVWHWRGHARSCYSSPYRPLFNVADNGYMIIDNRP